MSTLETDHSSADPNQPSRIPVGVCLHALQAFTLAPAFLPAPDSRFGTSSKRGSHWVYLVDSPVANATFEDTDGTVLLEMRSMDLEALTASGTAEGETLEWDQRGKPTSVDLNELSTQVHALATATLLARHWPSDSQRQEAAVALAGGLLRDGWEVTRVQRFLTVVAEAAGLGKAKMYGRAAEYAAKRLSNGKSVAGWPTVKKILGPELVAQVSYWLEPDGQKQPGQLVGQATPELPDLPKSWPNSPQAEAFYGLPGDIVRAIEPHSEADPVALLTQALVAFGNVIGKTAHFKAEADRHALNLYAVIVGRTSKARKGTSWNHIARLFGGVDRQWKDDRIQSGLSSGEGLIWAVKDELRMKKSENGEENPGLFQPIDLDSLVEEKRLLIVESEFASTLRVLAREGNTLSPTIRQAWDSGNLQILTKRSPAAASGSHISIIAHVSRDELRDLLSKTEMGNGFANRFLWVCARRSKVLPEGSGLAEAGFEQLVTRLREAVNFAQRVGEIKRDPEARDIWYSVYEDLSEGVPGLLGAVISRAEAQVMRLACLYALLDQSTLIRKEHLRAALALWEYFEASARFIFGDALGDPVADRVLQALRVKPEGLTRTEISNLFGRHQDAGELVGALACILELGLVERRREETGGRPAERWFMKSQREKSE